MLVVAVALVLRAPAALGEQDAPQVVQIAAGVYALLGTGEEVAPSNHGIVANNGFLVGSSGIAVIDTGSSYLYGQQMRAIMEQVSNLTPALVILTHQAPEFVFGASAFKEQNVSILADGRTARLIEQRCEICLRRLRLALGEEAMRGSSVTVPNREINATSELSVGGRALKLLQFGPASTAGDLAVFDPDSGTLFAGGLVVVGRIPEVRADSDLDGWLKALDELAHLPVKTVVPGFGPLLPRSAIGVTANYLRELRARVAELYGRHVGLVDAQSELELGAYRSWKRYPELHLQNIQRIYLQLEQRDVRHSEPALSP
ncbi:MAG: MBL fold metallo-hydrolase [Burkholderiaceae bacterium]|jgi:glyoxylase-like metal-dependent hydrolase (beta-lactamase superfamily II)